MCIYKRSAADTNAVKAPASVTRRNNFDVEVTARFVASYWPSAAAADAEPGRGCPAEPPGLPPQPARLKTPPLPGAGSDHTPARLARSSTALKTALCARRTDGRTLARADGLALTEAGDNITLCVSVCACVCVCDFKRTCRLLLSAALGGVEQTQSALGSTNSHPVSCLSL